jgi:hypothetical protein
MGLKGYRLWAMCQLDSTCRAPPRQRVGHGAADLIEASGEALKTRDGGLDGPDVHLVLCKLEEFLRDELVERRRRVAHAVALQVAFERQTLKPVFSLDRL